MTADIRWYKDRAAGETFTISTADELAGLADIVNGDAKGVKRYDFGGKTVKLAADIDLSGYAGDSGWGPIGNKYIDVGDGIDDRVFAGTFDGGGHTIKNLAINRPDGHYQGLFGCVSGGAVKALGLVGASVKGSNFVGCVAGYVAGGGSVVRSYSSGEVGGKIGVGGVVGVVDGGKVDNCYSTAAVSGQNEVGGVAGAVRSGGSGVIDSAALNPSVKSARNRPNAGRVAGKSADGATFSNNVAYAEMKNSADVAEWPEDPLNGEAIAADKIRRDETIGIRFRDGDGWTIAPGMLPGGAAAMELPGHLALTSTPPQPPVSQPAPSAPKPAPPPQSPPIPADANAVSQQRAKEEAASELAMVFVQGGTFMMGAANDQGNNCHACEKPAHAVTLSDYYIGKYPVTQRLWKLVMAGTRLADPSKFKGDDLPVESVSWNDIVKEFLPRLNDMIGKTYRLPTEAEWECAARGGSKFVENGSGFWDALVNLCVVLGNVNYKYAGGDDIDRIAWYSGNSGKKTHIVETKIPNELGIHDMSGNVWEWVNDWYGDYYLLDSLDLLESQTNPTGPSRGSDRVKRGGSWSNAARDCRVTSRGYGDPNTRDGNLGFRLALSA
jgi:formylglycine-generating enzyme required for sulfatase activity